MKTALIQVPVTPDKQANLDKAANYVRKAACEGAHLAILPEMFLCPYESANFARYAEAEGGPAWSFLSQAAQVNNIDLVAGSMPEVDGDGRIYNTSFVFDRHGCQIAKHRKMHLFDIAIEGGLHFRESDTLSPGSQVTVFEAKSTRIGLAICYDVRFPELSRAMTDRGAKILIFPGAFSMTTGPAHWELLLRTRAVDNQVFTVGVAPARQTDSSYVAYGHSMAVSPWGDILVRMDEKEGMAIADLDIGLADKVRQELPVLAHRRKDIYCLSLTTNPPVD